MEKKKQNLSTDLKVQNKNCWQGKAEKSTEVIWPQNKKTSEAVTLKAEDHEAEILELREEVVRQ